MECPEKRLTINIGDPKLFTAGKASVSELLGRSQL